MYYKNKTRGLMHLLHTNPVTKSCNRYWFQDVEIKKYAYFYIIRSFWHKWRILNILFLRKYGRRN